MVLEQDSTWPLGARAGQSHGHPSCLSAEVPGWPVTLSCTVKSEEINKINFHKVDMASNQKLASCFGKVIFIEIYKAMLGRTVPKAVRALAIHYLRTLPRYLQ